MVASPDDSHEHIRCPACGELFDPAQLDQVLYHANVPHRPIKPTGIIGERVEPEEDR
jgi:hypothetical protein